MIWLWILSVPLLILGILGIIGNYVLIANYYYAKFRKMSPLPTGSMVPLGGLFLGIGILLIPLDLSPYRLLYACIALFLDPWIWMILYLPIYLIHLRIKKQD